MTPTDPKGRAEEIAREILVTITEWAKLPSEQYLSVYDGIDLIVKALEEYGEQERAEGFLEGCSEESQRAIVKLGFNQGAAQMRERAAKVLLEERSDLMYSANAHRLADRAEMRIRALPLTPTEEMKNG